MILGLFKKITKIFVILIIERRERERRGKGICDMRLESKLKRIYDLPSTDFIQLSI